MRIGRLPGVTDLIGRPESASPAREFVRRKLGDNHPALDDVTLLVSEVAANAVVHSASRNGGTAMLALVRCPLTFAGSPPPYPPSWSCLSGAGTEGTGTAGTGTGMPAPRYGGSPGERSWTPH